MSEYRKAEETETCPDRGHVFVVQDKRVELGTACLCGERIATATLDVAVGRRAYWL